MRAVIVVGLVLGLAGCGPTEAEKKAAAERLAEAKKDLDEKLAKFRKLKAETDKMEADIAKQRAEREKKEAKPKVWEFKEAMAEALRMLDAIEPEKVEDVTSRLTPIEQREVSGLLSLELNLNTIPRIKERLIAVGFRKMVAKTCGKLATSDGGFKEVAEAVWKKIPSFRSPEKVASAASYYGMYVNSLASYSAFQHFPTPRIGVGPITPEGRDFWETFSGASWAEFK